MKEELYMPLTETYMSNILRRRGELVKLQQDKSKESAKIPTITQKIILAKKAISTSKSESTRKSRLHEIERCFSNEQAKAIVEYVDTAIGMNDSIGDRAAQVFAAQFYSAIGFGLSVSAAFNQAKAALMLEGIPEENTPELFVKDGLEAKEVVIVRPANMDY